MTESPSPYEVFECLEPELAAEWVPAVRQLFAGVRPAVHLRFFIPEAERVGLLSRFSDEVGGGHPRRDGVSGMVIGPSHFDKTTDDYFSEVEATNGEVGRLLGPRPDLLDRVADLFGQAGRPIRQAAHNGREAGRVRALAWPLTSGYMLEPHDDVAQLFNGKQADFEIHEMRHRPLVAVNLYPHVPAGGGYLRLWNRRTTHDERRALGLEGRGHPYPSEVVEGSPFFDVDVADGSLLLMDGSLVHAVAGYEDVPSTSRLILNCFVGLSASGESVLWV